MAFRFPNVKLKKQKFAVVVVTLIVLGALVAAGYFYVQYQNTQKLLINGASGQQNPELAQEEVKALVRAVGKLMLLPEGETPTVATVSDKAKLADQQFFAKAENGDKVLIYQGAKKAILYRPSTKKIIEVGPVNVSDDKNTTLVNANAATESASTKVVQIALLNGTNITGLTRTVEKAILDASLSVEVVEKANAAKNNYTDTLVIDIEGTNPQIVQEIADTLDATVGALPDGEEKIEGAQVMIIAGEDFTK